ncbi:plasmid SOS inhibition protein B [Klebsiella pneumoniae]|nr:plasmid SOS inhibition protein B [Klebsiella pneumoniae]
MKTVLTLDVLKTMSSDELEDYRAAGEDFRRELSHAVMRDLTSPSGWSVNAEYRCEFGGFFPVQIRFTPPHGHFDVAVCSPGELNPRWIVVFVTRDGQPFSVVRVMDAFNPELITLYGSTTYCNFYSHVKYSPLASSVRVIYVAFCCYTAPDIQPFFD